MIKGTSRIRLFAVLAVVLVVVGLGVAGSYWVASQINDQLGAPGVSGATGRGPCTSADAVNIQLVFADGHSVQACTHDRPACSNQTVTGTINGQSQSSAQQFSFDNQLRSSSRRYILFMRSDAAFAADMSEQTLVIDPSALMVKGMPGSAPVNASSQAHAVIEVTPRDPTGPAYIPGSGTISVSSVHGVVQGTIDASISTATRSDRPQPSTGPVPVNITGNFACNQ